MSRVVNQRRKKCQVKEQVSWKWRNWYQNKIDKETKVSLWDKCLSREVCVMADHCGAVKTYLCSLANLHVRLSSQC